MIEIREVNRSPAEEETGRTQALPLLLMLLILLLSPFIYDLIQQM